MTVTVSRQLDSEENSGSGLERLRLTEAVSLKGKEEVEEDAAGLHQATELWKPLS